MYVNKKKQGIAWISKQYVYIYEMSKQRHNQNNLQKSAVIIGYNYI
jgi:hypothetical protein